jgi:hypothetical protein
MSDIKSAWEIAQEKASKLGKLSSQEREEQRQEKCRLLGASLADKYLSHNDIRIIKDELNGHGVSDRNLVGNAVVRRLSQSLDFKYLERLPDISKAILVLQSTAPTKATLEKIEALFQEYQDAEKKQRQEIEEAGGQILHQMRISGPAIGRLNIRAKEEWQTKLDQTASPFDERLKSLKQELLLGVIGGSG